MKALRWLGLWVLGTAATTAVIWLVAFFASQSASSALAVGAIALGSPLLLARRRPDGGSALAFSLGTCLPLGWLNVAFFADQILVSSHWQCGTAAMGALMLVPFVQAILVPIALGIWSVRHRFASLWAPLSRAALVLVTVSLGVGLWRTATQGSDARQVWANQTSQVMPADTDADTLTTDDFVATKICKLPVPPSAPANHPARQVSCRLTLALTTGSGASVESPAEFRPGTPIRFTRLDGFVIISGHSLRGRGIADRAVFDLKRGRFINLRVSHVAKHIGPSPGVLVFALVGVFVVALSMAFGSSTPLVWQRLGARTSRNDGAVPAVIDLHTAHIGVLAVAGLPLLVAAWLGLVF